MPGLRPEPALSLAALRIVVPILLLVVPGFHESVRVAAWDPARFVVPEGLGVFVAYVPIAPGYARAAQALAFATALASVLGIYARPALALLTLACFYLQAIAQLAGHVWHDSHLLWFSALLAASPCDRVLAVDARRPLEHEGREYAWPLAVVRGLFAAIYFFPGVHKLARSGLAWALSDNLANQLYWKWMQHGIEPSLRLDRPEWLLQVAGLGVLAFELSFPLLVFFRKTRWLAVLAGLAFHLLSEWVFRIPFASLWLCYVALIDLRPLARGLRRWLGSKPEATAAPQDAATFPGRAFSFVAAVLLAGAWIQGGRGERNSFPFSCYPTFEYRAGKLMPDLTARAVSSEGEETELGVARSPAGYPSQRQWAEIWSLCGVTAPFDRARLEAYHRAVVRPGFGKRLPRPASVRYYRVLRSVVPEDRGRVARRQLLAEFRVD